jgi:FixJ family two-component response regulator
MPNMTGPQLVELVRELEPSLSVLYMSGYSQDVLGPDAHDDIPLLEKPFDDVGLLRSVHETIAAGAARRRHHDADRVRG